MKVQIDEPGRRLRLQQVKPAMSFATVLLPMPAVCIGAMVAMFAALGIFDDAEPAFLGMMALLFAMVLIGASWWLLRLGRLPRIIDVDRDAGTWIVHEASLLGSMQRTVSRPLAEIQELVLESNPAGRWRDGTRPYLQATVTNDDGQRWPFSFWVDDLDQRDELLDLAFRLATTAGLAGHHVHRNDPNGFGVRLVREAGEGAEPVPAIAGAARYELDEVGREVAVPQAVVPPFDPAGFDSAYEVERWEPGTQVTLRRPFGWVVLGFVGLLLAAFGGITVLFLLGALGAEGSERYVFAFIGLVGGVAVVSGLVNAIRNSVPRRTTVDWAAQVIRVRGPWSTTEIPFDGLREIEVRGHKHIRPASKGSPGGVYYRCLVVAHGMPRGETGVRELVLTETHTTSGDAATPVRSAQPLGVELAEALGVPHRYTDFD
jgi:hypothetical protein